MAKKRLSYPQDRPNSIQDITKAYIQEYFSIEVGKGNISVEELEKWIAIVKAKEEQFKSYQKVTLDNLFSSIEQGEIKELPIIVKADVQGSVEAVTQSLEKLTNEEVRVKVIHGGVGAVSESDVMLAMASGAIIVGFNVRPHPSAEESAKREGVEIRLYRVIYDAIEDITAAM